MIAKLNVVYERDVRSLGEAIERVREVARGTKTGCAIEGSRLADWLEELARLRESDPATVLKEETRDISKILEPLPVKVDKVLSEVTYSSKKGRGCVMTWNVEARLVPLKTERNVEPSIFFGEGASIREALAEVKNEILKQRLRWEENLG